MTPPPSPSPSDPPAATPPLPPLPAPVVVPAESGSGNEYLAPTMPRTRAAAAPTAPASGSDSQFQQETVRLVTPLRETLAAMVRVLASKSRIDTASDLQRATKLDMKLCWKVWRVITAPDGLAAARYIPGPANMRDLLRTMGRLGIPETLLERAADASARFERLVAEHAGDRRTFDSMVRSFAGADGEKEDLRQRRAAFQASSHIWGVQAEAMAMSMILRPSDDDPDRLDEIGIRGEYGVRRLRPTNIPLYEQIYATLDKEGKEYSAGRRRPLSGDGSGVALIREFSTHPLPDVVIREDAAGRSTATLMHSALGMKAAVDLVMGFVLRCGAPRYYGQETHSWSIAHLTKPFRVAIIDLILEEGTFPRPPRPRGFMTTKNSRMVPPEELWTTDQLSDGETVHHLGRGPDVLATAEVPRYPELIAWAIERAGWNPQRFETWRLRVEYPVVLSSVGLVFDMQHKP